ncbi:hypothetical protein ACHAXT_001492 [Thalassiosira profunda]
MRLLLVGIILVQWVCIFYILVHQLAHDGIVGDGGEVHGPKAVVSPRNGGSESASKERPPKFKGVAATLMMNNPKWFQRRYTMMIQNVLLNIPPEWGVQIFYTGNGQSQFGLDISPGLTRLMEAYPDRIVLTTIPPDVVKANKKPKQMWAAEWVWENMHLSSAKDNQNQNVLMFSGNGAFCSNSKTTIGDIVELGLNYVGMPSDRNAGIGGDGSTHGLVNRRAILDAIKTGKGHDGEERHDIFFLRKMMETNKDQDGEPRYKIATKEQTEMFGGISPILSKMTADQWSDEKLKKGAEEAGPPLIVSGTIPQLGNAARELMLDLCPELKVIFPSLHNPNCFGANPQGSKCAESICALKRDRKGGC